MQNNTVNDNDDNDDNDDNNDDNDNDNNGFTQDRDAGPSLESTAQGRAGLSRQIGPGPATTLTPH